MISLYRKLTGEGKQFPASLALLTLIPTLFSFLAIIFIQIGGIPIHWSGENYEGGVGGDSLALVKWKFTVTPHSSRTTPSHSVHLFLNRVCAIDDCTSSTTPTCTPYTRCQTLQNGVVGDWNPSTLLTPGLLGKLIERSSPAFSPFVFKNVVLAVTYAFYILTAVLLLPLGGLPLYIPGRRRNSDNSEKVLANLRKVRKYGMLFSGGATLSFLIASLIVTVQSHMMFNSIVKNTIKSQTFKSSKIPPFDLPDDWDRKKDIIYTTNVDAAAVGGLVMGLTWVAFVIMGLETVMWWFLWKRSVVPTADVGVEMK